jgi:hypothetical protein
MNPARTICGAINASRAAVQVLLDPSLVGIAQEVEQYDPRQGHEPFGFQIRIRLHARARVMPQATKAHIIIRVMY